jgi:F0F1-type ATP synthase assembly protein I
METSVDVKNTEEQEGAKNPNEFIFEHIQFGGSTRTIITVNDENIVIRKVKINDEKKTEKPKGEPVTINRSAIASVKIKRTFSIIPVLAGIILGAIIGFAFLGKVITLLIVTAIGFYFAFPKKMIILRKDGTKYKTIMSYDDAEYERFIKVMF